MINKKFTFAMVLAVVGMLLYFLGFSPERAQDANIENEVSPMQTRGQRQVVDGANLRSRSNLKPDIRDKNFGDLLKLVEAGSRAEISAFLQAYGEMIFETSDPSQAIRWFKELPKGELKKMVSFMSVSH